MPEKSKKPQKVHWKEITYVINNLTKKDLDVVDEMDVSLDHINNFMTEQVENGGHFKFTYDYDWGDCPNVSLVFYDMGFDNTGFGVSARGADYTHCMKILMYKFFEVANGRLYEVSEVRRSTRYG